ncbi:MAG TPA: methionyl-tRNA formyltransferase [Burkholderiales bacterium]|nr:methionyl-tRNA formyltransferase [Burkholderiales bacterium]
MRVIFAGTPDFAATSLQAIVSAGHEVKLAISRPDKPQGRGQNFHPSAVKTLALKFGIPVMTPVNLDELKSNKLPDVDVIVVVAYGKLIPYCLLSHSRFGGINIHASLLPRWRGAAPIQRAIAAGDKITGISIMQMDAGLDTGGIILQKQIEIESSDTSSSLYNKLKLLGACAIIEALARLDHDSIKTITQDETKATWATKLNRSESHLDLTQDAIILERLIRALNPWPGANIILDGEPVKIWGAKTCESSGMPGEILARDHQLIIACGKGSLEIQTIQSAGKRPMSISAWLSGHPIKTNRLIK